MRSWESDPAFADLRELAQKLEAALAGTNEALLKSAGLTPETVVDGFAAVQARLLGFDEHSKNRFAAALEDKRVKTLALGNIFATCVLTSAVALSEFRAQPRRADASALVRRLESLRPFSTNAVSLGAFAWASFYAVMGKSAWRLLLAQRDKHREAQKLIVERP